MKDSLERAGDGSGFPSSEIAWRLVDLQNKGIRTESRIEAGRRGGAGPSDDAAFRMGSTTVMLPAFNGPAENSPYTLVEGDDGYALQFEGKTLMYLDP